MTLLLTHITVTHAVIDEIISVYTTQSVPRTSANKVPDKKSFEDDMPLLTSFSCKIPAAYSKMHTMHYIFVSSNNPF